MSQARRHLPHLHQRLFDFGLAEVKMHVYEGYIFNFAVMNLWPYEKRALLARQIS
jgi:hypothetical protein